jgi:ATP-dependent RNA helicase HelY
VESLDRQIARKEREIKGRTDSLARQFDRVLRVLSAWGYVDGWSLTDAGHRLGMIYHEADLLVAECLRGELFDGLDPPEVAGLASAFTYETRGPGGAAPAALPAGRLRERWQQVEHLAHELNVVEHDAGLPETRKPDPGFVELARGWAAGEDLADLIAEEEMSGGDFVRNVKQLIDLLRQLGHVAPHPDTAAAARAAADALFRGVVAASSTVHAP